MKTKQSNPSDENQHLSIQPSSNPCNTLHTWHSSEHCKKASPIRYIEDVPLRRGVRSLPIREFQTRPVLNCFGSVCSTQVQQEAVRGHMRQCFSDFFSELFGCMTSYVGRKACFMEENDSGLCSRPWGIAFDSGFYCLSWCCCWPKLWLELSWKWG